MTDQRTSDPVDQKLNELDPERLAELAWPMWRWHEFKRDTVPPVQSSTGDPDKAGPVVQPTDDHQTTPDAFEDRISRQCSEDQQAKAAFQQLSAAARRRLARRWLEEFYRPYAWLQEDELRALTRMWFDVHYDWSTWGFLTGQAGGTEHRHLQQASACLDALFVALAPQSFTEVEKEVIAKYKRMLGPRHWRIYCQGTDKERIGVVEETYSQVENPVPCLLNPPDGSASAGHMSDAFRAVARQVWDRVRQSCPGKVIYSESPDTASVETGADVVVFLADGFYPVGAGEDVVPQQEFSDPSWLTNLEKALAAMGLGILLAGIRFDGSDAS